MKSGRAALLILFGLGVLVAPLAVEAQQPGKVPRIGMLSAGTASSNEGAFRQGLRNLGYIEEGSIEIVPRYAEGRFERLADLANELSLG